MPSERLLGGRLPELERRLALRERQRARLWEAERRALEQAESSRAETALLFRLAAAANEAARLEDLYEPALDGVLQILRVERAAILLLDEEGVMRFKGWRGLSDDYRAAAEAARHSPWAADDPDPRPLFVRDVRRERSLARLRPLLEREGIRSVGFVPFTHQRRLLGNLMVYAGQPRTFGEHEQRLSSTLAAHMAQVAARAMLLSAAEEEARRAGFLAEVSRVVSSSLDTAEMMRQVAHLAVPALADWCTVHLAEPGRPGANRLVAVAHVDPAKVEPARRWRERYPPDPDAPRGVARVLRTGEPELYREVPDSLLVQHAPDALYLAMLREMGMRSVMIVPMEAGGRVLGAISLVATEGRRRYGPADLGMAAEFARRTASAVENARLYAEAQHATRVREEILAVVSHDLKNPLGAILMSAGSLLRAGPARDADEATQRTRRTAETIQRAAARMSRLIEDLVDFSVLQAGRLKVERQPHPPAEIVGAAGETFSAVAQKGGVRLELETPRDLPPAECDRDRAIQALANLVSNAMKVTAAGGLVRVAAEARGAEIVFSVYDTGPGIPAEELPRLFDRYWRSERAGYEGTGLGLAIARGIVQAHGGRIWAESQIGAGSAFHFTLPAAPRGDDRSAGAGASAGSRSP